jgi:acetolactate synthase-1/2/3 large subunit
VVQSGAEEALQNFAELLSAPVITTFGANGAVPPEHRSFVGLPPHEPEVARLIGAAELLIAVGTDFDGMTTRNWTMEMPGALLAINCDATDLAKNYVPDAAVYGDAKLALEMLTSLVEKRGPEGQDDLVTLRKSTWARLRAEPVSASGCQLVEAVDTAARTHDGVVIADMAIAGYWVGGYGHFAKSRRLQYPVGWGTLGYALPASIGAATVSGLPVLAVCGDGGVMFALGELAVLRQENLPVTVLIVDDGGYGMLRYDQRHSGDQEHGVDLVAPDFVALAEAFGIKATTVNSIDGELATALDEALSSREPRVLVLHASLTPPRTTSPRWHE